MSEKEIVDRNAETVDTLVPLNEEVVQSDRAKILHDDGCDGIDFTRASIERNVSNPLVAEGAAGMKWTGYIFFGSMST